MAIFRRDGIAVFLAAFLAAGIYPGVFAEEADRKAGEATKNAEPQEVMVTIKGQVIDGVTGKPLPGVSVSSFQAVTQSDDQGRFSLAGIPQKRDAMVNFRVTDDNGAVIGCAFVSSKVAASPVAAQSGDKFAIAIVETDGELNEVVLKTLEAKGTQINDVCVNCHKPNPCLLAPGTDWTKVTHLGGQTVRQTEFEEIKAKLEKEGITREMYPNLRYQDAHPQSLNMVAIQKEGGKTAKGTFLLTDKLPLAADGAVMCDTCHTRHLPTEFQMFLRYDVAGENLLCRQCHS